MRHENRVGLVEVDVGRAEEGRDRMPAVCCIIEQNARSHAKLRRMHRDYRTPERRRTRRRRNVGGALCEDVRYN